MTRTFTVIVERDPETGWLIGSVAELPGCYTEAPDLQSLEHNMREAIDLYLTDTEIDDPLPDFVATLRISVPA